MANKINYDITFNNIIKELDKNNTCPTLLLHSCCAPCSTYVLSVLCRLFDITVFYYNPNIDLKEEFLKRQNEEKHFIELINTNKTEFTPIKPIKIVETNFDNATWKKSITGYEKEREGGARCYICYKLRLEETCKKAKELGFDYFGTTLSISPFKNSTWLNEIGHDLENKYNVKYLYSDFKKHNGYKCSIDYSKKYGLYRQDYCGCVYSKLERDAHKNNLFKG